MKCPRCDADLIAQRKCGKCGLNVDDYRKELEVEYKDFKTSELLEIRQKRPSGPSAAESTTVQKRAPGKAPDTKNPAKSPSDDKKNFLPILAIVVLALVLIAGAFFLLRYLIN
jgi:hypothetical protein